MKRVNILDCTLRDGGYLIDSQFGNTAIKGIIRGLTESGVDVIECGFLKDEPHQNGNTVFNNASQLRSFLPEDRRQASYVCLADYSRYHIEHLEPYDGSSIDGVRACFFKEERYEVIDFCRSITEKGYKLYVQPVDILGYTDSELLELIDMVNDLEPYAFSIVDTFGSLYREDLQRVFHLVHHNLWANARIGFHSHNNLQMSFSLSQEFIEMSQGLRDVVVDSSMAGMGRGAGNTNTELVMQYMNRKFNSGYDIDIVLDLIDNYIDGFHNQFEWGYSIPYFLAGSHSAHVNNISYLSTKAGIASRDINFLLNRLEPAERKRYDYDLLEKTYLEYLNTFKSYLINSIKIYCKEYLNIYKDYCALYIAGGEYLKSGRGAADKRVYDAAKGGEEEINKMDEINNKSKEKIKQAKDFLNNAKRKYNFKYFNPNETYDNAIKNKDKGVLRALLCGILGSDPTFATTQFEEALKYIKTESDIIHGEELDLEESYSKQSDEYVLDRSKWNEEYFQMLLLWLRYNFSLNKRLSNIKAVGKEVYKNKPTFGKSIKPRHESYIDMDYIMAVTEAEIYEMEL